MRNLSAQIVTPSRPSHRAGIMSGGGIVSMLRKKTGLMPGERHVLLKMPDGSNQFASFMGPGTNVMARLKRGDHGKTEADEIARAHDIRYSLAKGVGQGQGQGL
jgi:hypothetical protein